MEIFAELPKSDIADRREIFDHLCEMEGILGLGDYG